VDASDHVQSTARTNLRSQITGFVGRELDMEWIDEALEGSRLVMLVGRAVPAKRALPARLACA
jgi:hypothetical protein